MISNQTALSVPLVGIIGGSDGPTAIFITAKISWQEVIAAAAVLTVLIVTFVQWRKHRNK